MNELIDDLNGTYFVLIATNGTCLISKVRGRLQAYRDAHKLMDDSNIIPLTWRRYQDFRESGINEI